MKETLSQLARLTVVLTLAFIAGCASPGGPKFAASADAVAVAPPDKALIFIVRKPNFVGSANSWVVGIDGEPLVTVPNGGYFKFESMPGPIRFTTRVKDNLLNVGLLTPFQKQRETIRLDLSPGKTYYLKLDFGGQMAELPEDKGKADLAKCKKVVETQATKPTKTK